jgi:hypothetical protein
MKPVPKAAVAGIGIVAVLAFFFLAPAIPTKVPTYELYMQHGGCIGGIVEPAPSSNIYASPSYVLMQSGIVYVPTGGYLWWLPTQGQSSSLDCA